jgi:hypothetical protein
VSWVGEVAPIRICIPPILLPGLGQECSPGLPCGWQLGLASRSAERLTCRESIGHQSSMPRDARTGQVGACRTARAKQNHAASLSPRCLG